MKHRVFVYGTLKMGRGNHRYLRNCEKIGDTVTKEEYVLINCGFPYLIPANLADKRIPSMPVYGEVYEVDDATLRNLDMLEGEGSHYHRKTISTKDFGDVMCYVQLSMDGTEYPLCKVKDYANKLCYEY